MLGATLIIGIATVTGNLLADIAYGVLDPRIRHGG
jgi:peptide/nickel transport system permease protein